jgi:NADH:ubiquinone oxidoreductase subunit E
LSPDGSWKESGPSLVPFGCLDGVREDTVDPLDRHRLTAEVVMLAEKYGRTRSGLLPILQALQNHYRFLPDAAMQETADLLGLHPVEVYAVATFYSFLDIERQGRFMIRLCRTLSCDMKGKDAVARQLELELGVPFGQTTPDGRFSLGWCNCLGMCDHAPALLVNDRVFTGVTRESVFNILQGCRRALSSQVAPGRLEGPDVSR